MGDRKSSGAQQGLFAVPKPKQPVGPVYQGVCKQIRALFPADDADAAARKQTLEGTIAQARSVAESIDRVSGHPIGDGPPPRQAAGMQLAALHNQLDALLLRLSPDGVEVDEFAQLQADMAEADRVAAEAARRALADAPDYDDVGRG